MSGNVAEVKIKWSCPSTPSVCLRLAIYQYLTFNRVPLHLIRTV